MNREKAKDFFSAYHEGNLEGGLQQVLEQSFNDDPDLKAEYEAFSKSYEQLDAFKTEQIEVPHDLHDRTTAKLDKSLFEQKKDTQPSWIVLVRNLSFAGVAAAAIFGAIISLQSTGGLPKMGFLPGNTQHENLDQVAVNISESGDIQLKYTPSSDKQLTIREGLDGNVISTLDLKEDKAFKKSLGNDNPEAVLLGIQISGEDQPVLLAVPGQNIIPQENAEGTLEEFVLALANHFDVPVILQVTNSKATVSWKFNSTIASEFANNALESNLYSVDEKDSGVLVIQDR